MKGLYLLLFALIAILSVSSSECLAQAQCPWMNTATAQGFLGGDVQGSVSSVTIDGDATCDFKRAESSGPGSMLRIAVHTMAHVEQEFSNYLSLCGTSPVALKGIGNKTVQCIASAGASKGDELIVGRVRERAFVITIKAKWITDPPTSATRTRNPISDNSENIAEQVSGSMF